MELTELLALGALSITGWGEHFGLTHELAEPPACRSVEVILEASVLSNDLFESEDIVRLESLLSRCTLHGDALEQFSIAIADSIFLNQNNSRRFVAISNIAFGIEGASPIVYAQYLRLADQQLVLDFERWQATYPDVSPSEYDSVNLGMGNAYGLCYMHYQVRQRVAEAIELPEYLTCDYGAGIVDGRILDARK